MDIEKQEPSAVATAVAVTPPTEVNKPATGAPSIPMHRQEKQGAKCCGCL
jgi:hypothetical protein